MQWLDNGTELGKSGPMALDNESILKAALELPSDERADLAFRLLDSLHECQDDAAIREAWAAEIDRRLQDVLERRVKPISLAEARAELAKRFRSTG